MKLDLQLAKVVMLWCTRASGGKMALWLPSSGEEFVYLKLQQLASRQRGLQYRA